MSNHSTTQPATGTAEQYFLGTRIRSLRKRRGMPLTELAWRAGQEPHRYGNPGDVEAVVIWVITPPTF